MSKERSRKRRRLPFCCIAAESSDEDLIFARKNESQPSKELDLPATDAENIPADDAVPEEQAVINISEADLPANDASEQESHISVADQDDGNTCETDIIQVDNDTDVSRQSSDSTLNVSDEELELPVSPATEDEDIQQNPVSASTSVDSADEADVKTSHSENKLPSVFINPPETELEAELSDTSLNDSEPDLDKLLGFTNSQSFLTEKLNALNLPSTSSARHVAKSYRTDRQVDANYTPKLPKLAAAASMELYQKRRGFMLLPNKYDLNRSRERSAMMSPSLDFDPRIRYTPHPPKRYTSPHEPRRRRCQVRSPSVCSSDDSLASMSEILSADRDDVSTPSPTPDFLVGITATDIPLKSPSEYSYVESVDSKNATPEFLLPTTTPDPEPCKPKISLYAKQSASNDTTSETEPERQESIELYSEATVKLRQEEKIFNSIQAPGTVPSIGQGSTIKHRNATKRYPKSEEILKSIPLMTKNSSIRVANSKRMPKSELEESLAREEKILKTLKSSDTSLCKKTWSRTGSWPSSSDDEDAASANKGRPLRSVVTSTDVPNVEMLTGVKSSKLRYAPQPPTQAKPKSTRSKIRKQAGIQQGNFTSSGSSFKYDPQPPRQPKPRVAAGSEVRKAYEDKHSSTSSSSTETGYIRKPSPRTRASLQEELTNNLFKLLEETPAEMVSTRGEKIYTSMPTSSLTSEDWDIPSTSQVKRTPCRSIHQPLLTRRQKQNEVTGIKKPSVAREMLPKVDGADQGSAHLRPNREMDKRLPFLPPESSGTHAAVNGGYRNWAADEERFSRGPSQSFHKPASRFESSSYDTSAACAAKHSYPGSSTGPQHARGNVRRYSQEDVLYRESYHLPGQPTSSLPPPQQCSDVLAPSAFPRREGQPLPVVYGKTSPAVRMRNRSRQGGAQQRVVSQYAVASTASMPGAYQESRQLSKRPPMQRPALRTNLGQSPQHIVQVMPFNTEPVPTTWPPSARGESPCNNSLIMKESHPQPSYAKRPDDTHLPRIHCKAPKGNPSMRYRHM